MTLLDVDLPKQLDWLSQAARWTVGGLLTHASPANSGKGVERPTYRDYSPGDDYRGIDWNVCARHDELVWRRPPVDSNRRVYLLVDCSQSMSTGRPAKFDVARRIAAVLGTAALGHLDQLAVLAFAERITAELPLTRGSASRLKFMRFLDCLTPKASPTDLASVAECLLRRQRPGLAVVIGDFFSPESYRRGLGILRHHGHAACMVHVCDREDAEPNVLGDVELCDVETGDRWTAVLSRRDLARYRELFQQFCDSVRTFCNQRGIHYLRVREDTSWQRIVLETTGLDLWRAAIDRRFGFVRGGRETVAGAKESGDKSPHSKGHRLRRS
jgi:uncharacterized protein (DUF58 family)